MDLSILKLITVFAFVSSAQLAWSESSAFLVATGTTGSISASPSPSPFPVPTPPSPSTTPEVSPPPEPKPSPVTCIERYRQFGRLPGAVITEKSKSHTFRDATPLQVYPSVPNWQGVDGFSFDLHTPKNVGSFKLCVTVPTNQGSLSECSTVFNSATASGVAHFGFQMYHPFHWNGFAFGMTRDATVPDLTVNMIRTQAQVNPQNDVWVSPIQFVVHPIGLPDGKFGANGLTLTFNRFQFRKFIPTCGRIDRFGQTYELTDAKIDSYCNPQWISNQSQYWKNNYDPTGLCANPKIHRFELMKKRAKIEYAAEPYARSPEWDDLGACKNCGDHMDELMEPGTILGTRNHFRVGKMKEEYGGRWWFLSPQNRLFFSVGVNSIGYTGQNTPVQSRTPIFEEDLRNEWDANGNFNFYLRNIMTLLPPSNNFWSLDWTRRVLNRLGAWGFNTVANWSDQAVTVNSGRAGVQDPTGKKYLRLPYIGRLPKFTTFPDAPSSCTSKADFANDVRCPRKVTIPWATLNGQAVKVAVIYVVASDNSIRAIPDVYDPSYFQEFIPKILFAKPEGAEVDEIDLLNKDPRCIGVMVDNEPNYNLGYLDLNNPAHAYPFADAIWTDPRPSAEKSTTYKKYLTYLKTHPTADNYRSLTGFYAKGYFKAIRDGMKRNPDGTRGPLANKLYLGTRFNMYNTYPPVVLENAIPYVDVLTFNVNRTEEELRRLNLYARSRLTDSEGNVLQKPVIISEFQFTSRESRIYGAGVQEANHLNSRGSLYKEFMETAVGMESVIGAHWFKYIDQPVAGRDGDFENFPNGLVSVTDSPYKKTVKAMRDFNIGIYFRRWCAGKAHCSGFN